MIASMLHEVHEAKDHFYKVDEEISNIQKICTILAQFSQLVVVQEFCKFVGYLKFPCQPYKEWWFALNINEINGFKTAGIKSMLIVEGYMKYYMICTFVII